MAERRVAGQRKADDGLVIGRYGQNFQQGKVIVIGLSGDAHPGLETGVHRKTIQRALGRSVEVLSEPIETGNGGRQVGKVDTELTPWSHPSRIGGKVPQVCWQVLAHGDALGGGADAEVDGCTHLRVFSHAVFLNWLGNRNDLDRAGRCGSALGVLPVPVLEEERRFHFGRTFLNCLGWEWSA